MTSDPHPRHETGKPPSTPPPKLVPPDAAGNEKPAAFRKGPWLILGCGLLLIIIALLVLVLPLRQETPTTAERSSSLETRQNAPAPASPQNQGPVDPDTVREIDRLIGIWLQKQAEAEAANVAVWGGDTYSEAQARATECERLLGENQYLNARESCTAAIDRLDHLMASREPQLEEAVAAGQQALAQGNPQVAAEQFQKALAIDTTDDRAITGARRAAKLPEVLRFLQQGQALENAGDTEAALASYRQAVALDPEFLPAQQGLERVRASIAGQEFQKAMSKALQEMTAGRLSAARAALQKAEAIRPGDRAVRDLKQQLEETQLAGKLRALQQAEEQQEKSEHWREALTNCEQALALDPRAAFAVSCKERVGLRLNLDQRLKAILSKPERLFADGPLNEARQVLTQAKAVTPRGPALAAQIDQLSRLISEAEVEVEVVVRSDGLTDIVIYHVGRLGQFQEKHLILRTGNYTATGSRDGYRDVRKTFKVRPSSDKLVFNLRCEEPI
jgi:tetratricopeptide (TPR) repeat protein